jgi:hypothetical protein
MATDIQTARLLNRGLILEERPDLDPSVGSVVDSVLVDGAARLTVKNAENLRSLVQRQQLGRIAAGASEISNEEMDQLAAAYSTQRLSAQVAVGRVRVVVRDNRQYTVPSASPFTVGSLVFTVAAPVTVYSTVDPTPAAGSPRLQQVYDDETGFLYQFEFDIQSASTDPATGLVSGDRLVWEEGPSGLGYVAAVSNFTPGRNEETNQELAARLLEGVTAKIVAGRANVRALIQASNPGGDALVVGVNSPMMTRDRTNSLGVSTGGRVDVYVKSGGVSRYGMVVDAVVVDDVLRTVAIRLSREQAAGLYRASIQANNTATPPDVVSGELITLSYARVPWVAADAFNPLLVQQVDMAYSARADITYTVRDTRETSGGPVVDMSGGPGAVIENAYRIEVDYQPGILAADAVLTAAEVRPAGLDVLVKAAVPAVVSIGMTVSRPVDYNGPNEVAISAAMAAEINRLPISARQLDIFTLSDLLGKVDNRLTVLQASMTAVVLGQDGLNIPLTSINQVLTLPVNIGSKVAPENTYFTTTQSRVVVTLV